LFSANSSLSFSLSLSSLLFNLLSPSLYLLGQLLN
jgi:hypothetical protein